MNRTRFGLTGVAALGLGSLFALACNGKEVGSNTPEAVSVASSALTGTVVACNSGYAHPNACCTGSGCVETPSAVFHACESGATTFPDPRSCCSLDGSGDLNDCVPPPAAPSTPATLSCVLPCPPGQVEGSQGGGYVGPNQSGTGSAGGSGSGSSSPGVVCNGNGQCEDAGIAPVETGSGSGSSTGTGSGSGTGSSGSWPVCCVVDSNGATACSAPVPSSCACACPTDGPCPPCNCPDEPAQPLINCGVCPLGWNTPNDPTGNPEPDLCCRQDAASGQIDCFSQGVPPSSGGGSTTGPEGASDAGAPSADASVVQVSADACAPLPCPSGAQWNPATCSCD